MMKIHMVLVIATGLAYALLDALNRYVFQTLEFTNWVSWIYLPSGLRLALVLIFIGSGAMGVALGSTLVCLFYYFPDDPLTASITGMVSGLAPYLAHYACHRLLGLDLDLKNITPTRLLAIASIFAVTSSVMHQLVFSWRGYSENLMAATAVMIVGDLVGTIVVIYLAKLLILALAKGLSAR